MASSFSAPATAETLVAAGEDCAFDMYAKGQELLEGNSEQDAGQTTECEGVVSCLDELPGTTNAQQAEPAEEASTDVECSGGTPDPCLVCQIEAFEIVEAPICTGSGVKVEVKAEASAWGVNLLVFWYAQASGSAQFDVQWSINCSTNVEYYARGNGGLNRLVTAVIDTDAGHAGTSCHYTIEGTCETTHGSMPVGNTFYNGTTKKGSPLPASINACAKATTLVTGASRDLYVPTQKIEDVRKAVCGITSAITWTGDLAALDGLGLPII
ncbi:MAG: hypothetical protein AABY18_01520 [Candidatus Thermoplasmatota archaeon]